MADVIVHCRIMSTMSPPITCRCGSCRRCRERVRHRELRRGVERNRTCIAADCSNRFYANRANQYYCSAECRSREAQRRFRQTEKSATYAQRWRQDNPDKMREYYATWYAKRGKEVRKLYKQNKERINAHAKVMRALKAGKFVRQPCEICGAVQVDAHHDDYSQPLAVRWLCRKHHVAERTKE